MELAFKVVVTGFFTLAWVLSVRWVWTHQFDLRGTFTRAAERSVAPPDWIVTRDPNKIYQNGAVVGDVSGTVQRSANSVRFAQLSNTSGFRPDQPFEYQRLTLRILQVESEIGMKIEMTNAGARTLTGVFEGVVCEVVN
jgi:hypothetical protein